MNKASQFFFILLLGVLTGCHYAKPVDALVTKPAHYAVMNGWSSADSDNALRAFRRSCQRWLKQPQALPKRLGDMEFSPNDWWRVCYEAVDARNGKSFFQAHFRPYRLETHNANSGLLTGYYEPLIQGAMQRSDEYRYPVWALPEGVNAKAKMPERRQIDQKGLHGKADILFWVKDPVDLFFLHVQGSGRVKMRDGSVRNVGFAGKNGHEYKSIGGYLIRSGAIAREDMSLQSLKRWLRDNPDSMWEVLWQNPSYIFFQWIEGQDGPIGAHGVPLMAEASLAVDPAFIAYGIPLWLETNLPALSGQHASGAAYHKLVIAQDTGSAIKGGLRGDLFFGAGRRAEWLSGHMKQAASFYALVPGPYEPRTHR